MKKTKIEIETEIMTEDMTTTAITSLEIAETEIVTDTMILETVTATVMVTDITHLGTVIMTGIIRLDVTGTAMGGTTPLVTVKGNAIMTGIILLAIPGTGAIGTILLLEVVEIGASRGQDGRPAQCLRIVVQLTFVRRRSHGLPSGIVIGVEVEGGIGQGEGQDGDRNPDQGLHHQETSTYHVVEVEGAIRIVTDIILTATETEVEIRKEHAIVDDLGLGLRDLVPFPVH